MTDHGTPSRYKYGGCRCVQCTEAQRLSVAAYRAAHGVKRTRAQIAGEQRYEAKRKAARLAKRLGVASARVVGVRIVRLLSAEVEA